jgi:predicted RNA-binding protein with PUA-like domain
MKNYWLLKTEPSTFSVGDLAKAKRRTTTWDGIRNYQARNFLRDRMHDGDLGFLYHSSCEIPGVAGVVSIVGEAFPDESAFDKRDDHYDPDSDRKNPRWFAVAVRLERKFDRVIALDELRRHAKGKLKDLVILKRGNRLSVTPVTMTEWEFILSLADAH